jgi:hypothetical protein
MKTPVILCEAQVADNAFQAHMALVKAERDNPRLRANPHWTMLRQDAFERFAAAFERVPG